MTKPGQETHQCLYNSRGPREFTALISSVLSFLGVAFKCRTHQIIDFSRNKKQGVLLTADSFVVRLAGGVVL